jgi:hypothetical protein
LIVIYALMPTRVRDKLFAAVRAVRDRLTHIEGHSNKIMTRMDEVRGIAQQNFLGRNYFRPVARQANLAADFVFRRVSHFHENYIRLDDMLD